VKTAIATIPEREWRTFRDGEIAETVHCMDKTAKAFRSIVMRRPREQDLFEDKSPYRYHASEDRIKDLKIGFGRITCSVVRSRPIRLIAIATAHSVQLGFKSL
jgi:hypothetical protein